MKPPETSARKRAVVTGAAGGIGAAVARSLISAGVHVLATDLERASVSSLEAMGAATIGCDLTDPADRDRLVQAAGEVHFLANCHGVIDVMPLTDATPEDWDRIDSVNAKATFFLLQAFMPHVVDGGAIVNMASVAGKTAATTEVGIYSCSKAAVIAMTKTFAYALAARNVRVNCVCAGYIDTGMQDKVVSGLAALRQASEREVLERRLAGTPLGRMGGPQEVASVITFLLSDAASYMTGQAINVTGGLIMY